MKKLSIKFICLLLIIGLNGTGFLAVGNTAAYFNDTEKGEDNLFQAGILNFNILNYPDFSPEINQNQFSTRKIELQNEGSLDFKYKIRTANLSGNACQRIILKEENGNFKSLNNFETSTTTFSNKNQWNFKADALNKQGGQCNFDFVISGWQTNLNNNEGFTDKKIISNTIKVVSQESPIVLNEFLPNANNYLEFIELYNNSNDPIDLDGYKIRVSRGVIPINSQKTSAYSGGTTIIPGKGWLVVAPLNSSNNVTDMMDNMGGTVTLLDRNQQVEIDSYTYGIPASSTEITPGGPNATSSGEIPVDKSYARIPDGIGDWVDPIPTPGSANQDQENNLENNKKEDNYSEVVITSTTSSTTDGKQGTTTQNEIDNSSTSDDVVSSTSEKATLNDQSTSSDSVIENNSTSSSEEETKTTEEKKEATTTEVTDNSVVEEEIEKEEKVIEKEPETKVKEPGKLNDEENTTEEKTEPEPEDDSAGEDSETENNTNEN